MKASEISVGEEQAIGMNTTIDVFCCFFVLFFCDFLYAVLNKGIRVHCTAQECYLSADCKCYHREERTLRQGDPCCEKQ